MQICSDGHDEVAYEDNIRECPVCREISVIKELNEGLDDLKNQLEELKN